MPIQKPTLPAPSPLDAADPIYASEAVRRRIRRRWAQRRDAGAPNILTVVGEPKTMGRREIRVRVSANEETVERCLQSPATAERLNAWVERRWV